MNEISLMIKRTERGRDIEEIMIREELLVNASECERKESAMVEE